uniref:Glycosyl-4,4'-diaponeurosporenoate acyltransferase n=1 Tax=Heterorhabditis bacteriophora TaxID=37862 RepID=A0A1I7X9M2_HETBA
MLIVLSVLFLSQVKPIENRYQMQSYVLKSRNLSSPVRYIQTTCTQYWQNFENERHFEPGEDVLKRTWHGLTYDFKRWKRRYQEVCVILKLYLLLGFKDNVITSFFRLFCNAFIFFISRRSSVLRLFYINKKMLNWRRIVYLQFLYQEEDDVIDHSNLEVDYNEFYDKIWPILVKRVPAFQTAKVRIDFILYSLICSIFLFLRGILEDLIYITLNFGILIVYFRGAMHSIAAGRAYSEKVFDGAYVNINLRRFDMRRIVKFEKLEEIYKA